MKINILRMILGICLTGISFTACNLDVLPTSDIVSSEYWNTEKEAWYALNGCYSTLPGIDIWDEMCTDDAHSHKPWEGNYELVQQNGISAATGYGNYNFSTIRIANNFIANVDRCDASDELKIRMKAEARFLRAMSYLDLTTKFGKVAVIEDVLAYDAPNVKRDEVETVQNFILKELQEIADILPDSYPGGYLYEKGRITRGGALALRARAALYFGNYTEAEKSAKTIITEGHHSLFRLATTLNAAQEKEAKEMESYIDFDIKNIDKDKFIKGMFSYESLWHADYANPDNPEYMVTRGYMADPYLSDWSRYTYFIPQQLSIYEGYISFEPMQSLIDSYWNVDGQTMPANLTMEERKNRFNTMWSDFEEFENDQSGYFQKVQSTDLMAYDYMKEFRNRDSRLYASILFPFKGWHETVKGSFYFMFNPGNINQDDNESYTGFAYRKIVALSPYNESSSSDDYPVIRYAEVLLTFAEARIINSGWDQDVQDALNDLRDRCGMPDVPSTMPSKDAALNFVRNERRIELAAEGQRYDDIRRYGKTYCAEVMNGPSYSPDGSTVINKVWGDRLMLMPVPQSAIDLNPLLKGDQNPGY